jgi:hypothetical protein
MPGTTTVVYINFITGASPLQIGAISLGYAHDFGYPLRPESFSLIPTTAPVRLGNGNEVITRFTDPISLKVVTFADQSTLTDDAVYEKTVATTIMRDLSYYRYPDHVSAYYAGLGGLVCPVAYHEGTANGLSVLGRPAYYANIAGVQISRNSSRRASTITLTLKDLLPRGLDYKVIE